MNIKTFRAKTMQLALDLVRSELGPEATVLHTRELNGGLIGRLVRGRQYEIAASTELQAPSRMPPAVVYESSAQFPPAPLIESDYRSKYRDDVQHLDQSFEELHTLGERLRQQSGRSPQVRLPDALFQVYTDMIESDIEECIAQELIERLQVDLNENRFDRESLRERIVQMIADELQVAGPIDVDKQQRRIIALVGPTGVGKTTTIAKLAANFRLRENKRVGLITVDTYRIAAVEQLRTYAEIIDLPMEVVSTPREMREAIARMKDLDLVLMDTAGRSPRDEVKIQELKSMLAEAAPDEVHLVLSAVTGAKSLQSTAERFATVGATAMIMTKLDEATALGNLLSVTRSCDLPISYLTDGQNVPDDIQVAEKASTARSILSLTA